MSPLKSCLKLTSNNATVTRNTTRTVRFSPLLRHDGGCSGVEDTGAKKVAFVDDAVADLEDGIDEEDYEWEYEYKGGMRAVRGMGKKIKVFQGARTRRAAFVDDSAADLEDDSDDEYEYEYTGGIKANSNSNSDFVDEAIFDVDDISALIAD
ncbi:hypothetical protein LTR66_016597 [Elasticomyces elasticus]|nr:hypothetical protein LTR66_016597 [Elasticomyces elasticus]